MKTIHLIGAGRLGSHLGRTLLSEPNYLLSGICNQSLSSSEKAVNKIGGGRAYATIQDMPRADLWFLCCNDAALPELRHTLMCRDDLESCIVLHFSGVLDHYSLSTLKEKGAYIGSFHPQRSFTEVIQEHIFEKCMTFYEGMPEAIEQCIPLFQSLGMELHPIRSDNKALYHAAACMANNYLTTLAHSAQHMFEQSGVQMTLAKKLVITLMQNVLDNLKEKEHFHEALTGPLVRGDVCTIEKHLRAIEEPSLKRLYESMGIATVRRFRLAEEAHTQCHTILEEGLSKN